jgi:hypothetical protein
MGFSSGTDNRVVGRVLHFGISHGREASLLASAGLLANPATVDLYNVVFQRYR